MSPGKVHESKIPSVVLCCWRQPVSLLFLHTVSGTFNLQDAEATTGGSSEHRSHWSAHMSQLCHLIAV